MGESLLLTGPTLSSLAYNFDIQDEYSKDNKCSNVEVSEECDDNISWCEVEWADEKISTKQCAGILLFNY